MEEIIWRLENIDLIEVATVAVMELLEKVKKVKSMAVRNGYLQILGWIGSKNDSLVLTWRSFIDLSRLRFKSEWSRKGSISTMERSCCWVLSFVYTEKNDGPRKLLLEKIRIDYCKCSAIWMVHVGAVESSPRYRTEFFLGLYMGGESNPSQKSLNKLYLDLVFNTGCTSRHNYKSTLRALPRWQFQKRKSKRIVTRLHEFLCNKYHVVPVYILLSTVSTLFFTELSSFSSSNTLSPVLWNIFKQGWFTFYRILVGLVFHICLQLVLYPFLQKVEYRLFSLPFGLLFDIILNLISRFEQFSNLLELFALFHQI